MKQLIQKSLNKVGYGLTRIRQPEDDTVLYHQLFPQDSLARKAFYNISFGGHFGFGGKFSHPLWTNIDVDRQFQEGFPGYNPETDIAYDPFVKDALPLEDNSAELFHSRFAFEHIQDEHARHVLKEIHRCLKPGGIIHIVIPNLEFDYHAYHRQDWSYFHWIENFSRPEMMELMRYSAPMREMSMHQVFLIHFATNASPYHLDGSDTLIEDDEFIAIMQEHPFEQAMDLCTSRCSLEKHKLYRQNHINWWNPLKIQKFLKEAGFSYVVPVSAGQSITPVMRDNLRFDHLWNEVTLVVEAIK